MSIPPVLFARVQNGPEAIGYRLLAGNALSQIPATGAYIGSGQVESNNLAFAQLNNRMVEFGNKVFVWVKEKIYEIDTDSGTWVLVHTITASPPTTGGQSGLYHVAINGVPSLIGLYPNDYYITYDEDNGWQEFYTGTNLINTYYEMFVYRNVVFCYVSGGWGWFDPSLPSFSSQTPGVATGSSFAVHKGVLYAMNYASDYVYLYRFTGSSFTGLGYLGSASIGERIARDGRFSQQYLKGSLVAFDGNLYAFCWGRPELDPIGYNHLEVFKLTASGATVVLSTDEVHLTASVSPWQTPLPAYSYNKLQAFADYDTDPDNPELYFFVIIDSSAGTWVTYKWNGESSLMTSVGTIGAYGLAPALSKDGGGDRVWTRGTINCSIEGRAKGNGGIEYTVRADGDPLVLTHGAPSGGSGFEQGETVQDQTTSATATIVRVNATAQTLEVGGVSGTFGVGNVVKQTTGTGINTQATVSVTSGGTAAYKLRLYFSGEEEPPGTQGTLIGTPTGGGAIRNGNVIENVTADGITEYTFLWAFAVDGIAIGQYFTDRVRISVS